MPNLSSNTLFHFTSRKWILDKLEHGFKPRYSPEFSPTTDGDFFNNIIKTVAYRRTGIDASGKDTYERVENNPLAIDPVTRHIPMVCFCDIPMTRLDRHMNIYNKYGIGLTKAWGINKGINPIMYINEESTYFKSVAGRLTMLSMLYHMLQTPFDSLEQIPPIHHHPEYQKIVEVVNKQAGLFMDLQVFIKTYFKPYQSKGEYRGQSAPYRYYDEKEWRYIPYFQEKDLPPLIESNIAEADLAELNRRLEAYPLTFNPADIKYILVDNSDDIEFIVEGLNDIKDRTHNYSTEDVTSLTAKIITPAQIEEQSEEDL